MRYLPEPTKVSLFGNQWTPLGPPFSSGLTAHCSCALSWNGFGETKQRCWVHFWSFFLLPTFSAASLVCLIFSSSIVKWAKNPPWSVGQLWNKWKCMSPSSHLWKMMYLFTSGAKASFVHLFYFVLAVMPASSEGRRKCRRATCLLSSEEQGVHSVNLVDCNLLDGFSMLHL